MKTPAYAGLFCLAIWVSRGVDAQTVAATGSAPELQEIIVTAGRNESKAQETPIAVTALSGATLREAGISDVDRLALSVPGLSFGDELGEAHIAIRGIGSDAVNPGADPRVAYYQDGIYVGRPTAQLGGFFDLERVEVLKGPQGTLYGRNATAGAISVISRGPTAETTGYADLSYGNHNATKFEGAIGGGIAANLSGRLAVQSQYRNGYGKNIITGNDIDNQLSNSVRASLRWDPIAALSFLTIGELHKENDRNGGVHFLGVDNPAIPILGLALGGAVPADSRDVASVRDPFTHVTTYALTETITGKFDWATLKSYTSWRKSDATFGTNVSGTSLNLTYGTSIEDAHQVSEELQLSGTAGPLHWLAGALFYYEHMNDSITFPLNLLLFGGPDLLQQGYIVGGTQSDRSTAPYLRLTYDITDQASVILGARYTHEKKDIDQTSQFDLSRPYSPGNPVIPLPGFPNTDSRSYTQVSPSATLDYKLTPNVFLYASYTEGFKSGGFNFGIPQAPYQPEKIKEYELGLKSTELHGRVQLNADLFYYDYNNLQVTIIRGTNAVIENAATAALYGADIDLVALPLSNLRLEGSLALLHSEYINYSSANPAFPTDPAQPLGGKQLTQAPRYEGRLGGEYSWNVAGGALKLRGDFSYTSRTYFTPFNEKALSQGGHSLTNGGLDYTAGSGSWHAGLFVNNLTNNEVIAQDYVASLLFGSPVVGVLTPPRTYGVRAGVSF